MPLPVSKAPARPLWLTALLLALAYYAINFVLTANSLSPVHQDDYLALGYGFEDMRWGVSRPVSTNLIYFMGEMGPTFSFLLLSAMTVAMALLVLRFVERAFGREFEWHSLLLFSAISFAHMASFEHGKLLGLATTLSSNVAGLLAMCLLWDAWTRKSGGKAMAAVAAYLVAVFAKEDFILPPLVLLAWLWLLRLREARAWREAFAPFETALTLAVACTAAASIAYNFLLTSNPFVSGVAGGAPQDAPYAVDMTPAALASAFWTLTFGYAPLASGLAVAAAAVGMIAKRALRWPLVLVAALILALMLPYALIPNNMPEFRVYGWLPWFGGIVAMVLASLVPAGDRLALPVRKVASALPALCLAAIVMWQANPHRQGVAGWYALQQGANERMLQSLREHRSSIAREQVVGIVGVDGLSPWSNTDAQFLRRKLYFDNRWIVFVEKDSMFYQIDPVVDGRTSPRNGKQFVLVEQSSRLCDEPALAVLVFDPSGAATMARAADLCAGTHAAKPAPAP